MSRTPVAVLAPILDGPSESFVRRHLWDLDDRALRLTLTSSGRSHQRPPRTVVLSDEVNALDRLSVLAHRGAPTLATPRLRRRVVETLRQLEPEVLLLEYLDVWLPLVDELARSSEAWRPLVFVHAHGYDVSAVEANPERFREGLSRVAGLIAPSDHARRRLCAALGLPEDLVSTIPCGVDVPTKPPAPPARAGRIVAIGRLVAKKDPVGLVRAFARAHAVVPEATLDIAGDGPLRREVERACAKHGLTRAVRLHGAVDHAHALRLLYGATAFAQMSRVDPETGDQEGLPVAILEAMAAGLPVLSTVHAGIPEAVIDGTTGHLVGEEDWVGLGDAMVSVLQDEVSASRMGAAGHRRALDRFSWMRERQALRALLGLR